MSGIPHGRHLDRRGRPHVPDGVIRDGAEWPILFDGCEACEEYADRLGLGLDAPRFAAAWQLMVRVEYQDDAGYLSAADKKLGHGLYTLALLMERNMGIDPRTWPPTATGHSGGLVLAEINARLRTLLVETRPYVYNAMCAGRADGQPWREETANELLERVDREIE